MEGTWCGEADGLRVHVRMVHALTWRWAPLGPWMAQEVIGEVVVRHSASNTLRTLTPRLESHAASPAR
jgi:hypothetical protein